MSSINDQNLAYDYSDDVYFWDVENDKIILDVGGYDKIRISDFIGDMTWSREEGSKDLYLNINGRVLLVAGFFEEITGIEQFIFANGDILTRTDIIERLPMPIGEGKLILGKDAVNHEFLVGTEYNDTIDGGAGKDLLEGGYGNDTYIWGPGHGTDVVRDYGGQDKIVINALPAELKFYTQIGDKSYPLIIQYGDNVEECLIIEGYFNDEPYKNGQIELIVFSDGTSWTLADVKAALGIETPPPPPPVEGKLVLGTADSETLEGTTRNDTLDGGAGDDLMKGGAGNDIYRWAFGNGNDTISDSRGTDTLSIHANTSEVQVTAAGEDFEDLLISLHDQKILLENYFLIAEDGGHIEKITFADGHAWTIDSIWKLLQVRDGSSRDDVIYGKAGKDSLKGNDGHDVLIAGHGNDALNGGAGNDKLTGGIGADILTGGTGRDVFIFGKGEMGLGKNRDVILDFTPQQDRIDLRGIDANSRTKPDDAFGKLLSAKKAFSDAGQMRYDAKTGILSLNTDKDAAAEFEIMLKNKPALLKLSDFYL